MAIAQRIGTTSVKNNLFYLNTIFTESTISKEPAEVKKLELFLKLEMLW